MGNIIEAVGLTKTYYTHKRLGFLKREKVVVNAVDNISFSIAEGSICGILGPNGAGKSTTIKMLCGTLYPTSGEVTALGLTPYSDRKKYVQEIGAVFGQKSQLIWDIPPLDSFNMNRAIYGVNKEDYKTRLQELCDLFEVDEVMRKPTRVLSLGERMKCEFIMAMLHKPKVVFLDEPTIGLDVIAKNNIREFIKKVNAAGTTFILTTHDLDDVKQLADRVIIINRGAKVFDDTLTKLQLSLGEKKIVELILEKPYMNEDFGAGAQLIEQKSPFNIVLEVDVSDGRVGAFIERVSKKVSFSDISVKELPMEKIITEIYL